MKYILLIYANEKATDKAGFEKCIEEATQLAHSLVDTGNFVSSSPLCPTHTAMSVRVRDGKAQVTDGPFAETKEQLGGYFLIEASDITEAVAIAERIPVARWGTIEVRPLMELPDLMR